MTRTAQYLEGYCVKGGGCEWLDEYSVFKAPAAWYDIVQSFGVSLSNAGVFQ